MFDKLQQLPLFAGLSPTDLITLTGQTKLAFNKHPAHTVLASQGDRCDQALYILSGQVTAQSRYTTPTAHVIEHIPDTALPLLLEPWSIWGPRTRYTHAYTFETPGHTLTIDKHQLIKLLTHFDIIRANILNLLCSQLRITNTALQSPLPATTAQKVQHFIRHYSLKDEGKKTFHIRMDDLARHISEPRLNVSRVLNQWQEEGHLHLMRGGFHINDTKALLQA